MNAQNIDNTTTLLQAVRGDFVYEEEDLLAELKEKGIQNSKKFSGEELLFLASVYYTINGADLGDATEAFPETLPEPRDSWLSHLLAERVEVHLRHRTDGLFVTLVNYLGGSDKFKDLPIRVRALNSEEAVELCLILESVRSAQVWRPQNHRLLLKPILKPGTSEYKFDPLSE